MEALEFLKEAQRMCRSNECFLNCPVHDVCFLQNYDVVSEEDMKTFVSSIEVWSKKNPPMTNAQKFEEVFGPVPSHKISSSWTTTNTENENRILTEDYIGINVNWWDEPYKEPEHEL